MIVSRNVSVFLMLLFGSLGLSSVSAGTHVTIFQSKSDSSTNLSYFDLRKHDIVDVIVKNSDYSEKDESYYESQYEQTTRQKSKVENMLKVRPAIAAGIAAFVSQGIVSVNLIYYYNLINQALVFTVSPLVILFVNSVMERFPENTVMQILAYKIAVQLDVLSFKELVYLLILGKGDLFDWENRRPLRIPERLYEKTVQEMQRDHDIIFYSPEKKN